VGEEEGFDPFRLDVLASLFLLLYLNFALGSAILYSILRKELLLLDTLLLVFEGVIVRAAADEQGCLIGRLLSKRDEVDWQTSKNAPSFSRPY
jgi:hypothetical protein